MLNVPETVVIKMPFIRDYGINCEIGEDIFLNHNCYLMDCAKIKIEAKERIIEDNVWLGGGVTITPGVTIGTGTVIGTGSVITKDIPANVVAVSNPCKPIKKIYQDNNITM